MALPQEDQPFTWGSGGARLTTDEIAQRRKEAALALAQGTDATPLPAGTRGAGVWTQGLARVAKAISGGLDIREADAAAKANAADNKAMIASLLGGGAAPAGAPMDITPKVAADTPAAPAATSDSPRGIRNNNPLNIEDGDFARSQPGYAGTDGRFAKFASPDHGVAAADSLLNTYQTKHGLNTVNGIVNRWAPTSDGNNTSAYAADVAKQLGIDPNAPIPPEKRQALIAAMGRHENGVPISMPGAAAPAAPTSGAPVQVASNGPVQMPSAPAAVPVARPAAADQLIPASVANVAAALSPSTVQGAAYPSPVLDNTGPAVPGNFSIPGMPAVQPMAAQDPVRFAGQPGFVPPQAAAVAPTQDAAIPENATPTEGALPASVAKIVQAQNAAVAPSAAPAAAVAAVPPAAVARVAAAMPPQAAATTTPVRSGISAVNPGVLQALTSPYSDENTKKIAGIILQQQMTPKEVHAQETDAAGNVWDVNRLTGQRTVVLQRQASFDAPYRDQDGNLVQKDSTGKISMLSAADKNPTSVNEFEYGQKHPGFNERQNELKKLGPPGAVVNMPGEHKGLDEAFKLDAEAVRKGQNEQMPALEDADRNFQMMQDAIDRNGGKLPTGGVLAKLGLDGRRTSDYIRNNWGIDLGDDPTTAANLETFNKGGIKASGEMAKAIGGNRVLKVEFDMAQRANPGLETTDGGNKYLIDLNRNTIAIQKDRLQAQEDYWREHNHSLDGFQKVWNAEVKTNPRPLSTFSVVPPIDLGDGSKVIKLPSTAQGGYSWYQKGPNGTTLVTDPAAISQAEDATKPAPKAATAPLEKVIGGKTYVKQDGNWFEKH